MGAGRNRWALWAAGVVAGGLVGGCGETANKPGDAAVNWGGASTPAVVNASGTATARPAAGEAPPTPPKDARYTISCKVFNGPASADEAKLYRDNLLRTTPLRKWYVLLDADHSTLYYGFYRTFDSHSAADADEARRAHEEMDSVRLLATSDGYHPFSTALWVPIDSPDPAANPAWDLTKSKGYWSLEIGVFKNVPNRKELAVSCVNEARAHGIEAYYYHGETASSVCIGAWPKESVLESTVASQNIDPTHTVLVLPGQVPTEYEKELNGNVTVASEKVEIEDPTVSQAMRDYPQHAFNSWVSQRTDPQTGKAKPDPSFLVVIPHTDTITADGETKAVAPAKPTGPADRTVGGLKGLE